MALTKVQLFQKLKEAVSPEEWEALAGGGELVISRFNRSVLMECRNTELSDEGELPEDQVSGLYNVLKEYLKKHMADQPSGWKWIIISSIYLTFIAGRPMHPIDILDIKVTKAEGGTVYECPEKSRGRNTACHYCVCRRMSNYEIMKRKMQKEFLKYDQEQMIQKFSLDYDADYIYIKFLGHRYRISRKDGKAAWSDDDFLTYCEAGYNEAMTIYDVLCYSEENCSLSGEFVNMNSLSSVQSQPSAKGGGLLQEVQEYFDHKGEALAEACRKLNGTESGKGDIAYCIPMFDFLPVGISFWNSDEEFPASLQVFTDRNMLKYMHYETLWFAVFHLFERMKEEISGAGGK